MKATPALVNTYNVWKNKAGCFTLQLIYSCGKRNDGKLIIVTQRFIIYDPQKAIKRSEAKGYQRTNIIVS